MATAETQARTASIAFDGGLNCSLGVSSLDRSIPWYCEHFGIELVYRDEKMAWCELTSPVARVTLGLSQVEKVVPSGGATLTFGVVDLDAAKAVLDAAGVRQDSPILEIPGMVRLLTFYDPDDNALMLYQDLTIAPAP